MKINCKVEGETLKVFDYVLSYAKNGWLLVLGEDDYIAFQHDEAESLNDLLMSAGTHIEEFSINFDEKYRENFAVEKKFIETLEVVNACS